MAENERSFWDVLETALEVEITAFLMQISTMANGSPQRPSRQVMIWREITNWLRFHSYQQLAGTQQRAYLLREPLLRSRIHSTLTQRRPRQRTRLHDRQTDEKWQKIHRFWICSWQDGQCKRWTLFCASTCLAVNENWPAAQCCCSFICE